MGIVAFMRSCGSYESYREVWEVQELWEVWELQKLRGLREDCPTYDLVHTWTFSTDSTISFSFQGGETHGGSLFIIGLNDLYEGKTEAVSIYSESYFKMYSFWNMCIYKNLSSFDFISNFLNIVVWYLVNFCNFRCHTLLNSIWNCSTLNFQCVIYSI